MSQLWRCLQAGEWNQTAGCISGRIMPNMNSSRDLWTFSQITWSPYPLKPMAWSTTLNSYRLFSNPALVQRSMDTSMPKSKAGSLGRSFILSCGGRGFIFPIRGLPRNQGISSSSLTSVTVMSTLCCQPKNYTEHLQSLASVSSPQTAVQLGTWSCFVPMMSRPGPAGSQPCAC